MIPALIVGCEILFWLFVLAGLICRYILKFKRTGALLLMGTPLIDAILLILAWTDLKRGAEASFFHGLAAVYIGVSVAFGHRMIRWADSRFAYRFAGGPAPVKKPAFGREHARNERRGWLLHLLAWGIGCVILYGMVIGVNVDSRTEQLLRVIQVWTVALGIDFIVSFSYTLWPRKAKGSSSSSE